MSIKSPCVDVCVFDGATGWCVACGRSRQECAQWRKMTPFRAKAVLAELPRRLEKLERMERAPSGKSGEKDGVRGPAVGKRLE
jgi:predicted Fe-S protein YdhL (DUF1289 family)